MILLPSLHLGSLLHVLCKRAGLLNRTASALGRLPYTHTPITSRGASRAWGLYSGRLSRRTAPCGFNYGFQRTFTRGFFERL